MFEGLTNIQSHLLLSAVEDKLFLMDRKKRQIKEAIDETNVEGYLQTLTVDLRHLRDDMVALTELRSYIMSRIDMVPSKALTAITLHNALYWVTLGRIIQSCTGNRYDQRQLAVTWRGEHYASFNSSGMTTEEIKGEWTVMVG